MAKIHIRLLTCLFLLWASGAISAVPQQASKPASLPEQLPVYIVDFSQDLRRPEVVREIGDLGALTGGLIHLRLLEIPSVTVHLVQTAPPCGDSLSTAENPSQAPPIENPGAAVAPPGDFYIVHGSIETQLPNIVLNYFVDKCEGRKSHNVFQDTQPFTLDHALDEITIAAHAIAFKIERVIPATELAVEPFQSEGDLPEQKDIQAAVQNGVIQAISKSSDYKLADTSDYKIGGQLMFQKNARHIGVFPGGTTIKAVIHVDAHERVYQLKPVPGSRDQLPKFYADVADEVMRELPEVLLAEHLQLPDIAENMKADARLAQANQLLAQCSKTDHDCESAQDAIRLLSAAVQQNSRTWKVFLTLGQAQVRAGKNADAILSLEKARNLIKQDIDSGSHISSADQVQVLNLLGDSYLSAEKYGQAEAAYDDSLRLDPSQTQLYGSKARAFQFNDRRLEALDTIFQGLKVSNESDATKALHELAVDIIGTLQVAEFEKAEAALDQAFHAGVPVANEYALLTSLRCEQISGTGSTPESRQKAKEDLKKALDRQPTDPGILASIYGDLARAALLNGDRQELNDFLDKAETLPPDQVRASTREWIKRLRALDQINNAEYEKAYESADTAYHIKPTDYATSLAAEAMLWSARCKDTAWKLGKEEAGLEQCKRQFLLRDEEVKGSVNLTPGQELALKGMYQQAADRIAPLVAKRYLGGDFVFMRANHFLDQDNKTLEQFTRIVQKDPKDASALDVLMFACSQYLFNFDCAFSAAQKSARLLDPNGASASGDYLDVAEMAVLKGDDKQALDWLRIASAQPQATRPRDASLIYLYRLWVAMRKGQSDEFKTDFESWKEATVRFRDSKDNLGWSFRGAREALDRSRSVIGKGNAGLLRSMMDALEDNRRTLPSWPESGSL